MTSPYARPWQRGGRPSGLEPIVIHPLERRHLLDVAAAVGLAIAAALCAAYAIWRGAPLSSGVVVIVLAPAIVVDVIHRQIPDRLVGLAILAGASGQFGLWMSTLEGGEGGDVLRILAGAAALGGPLLVVHLLAPAAMGFGDVKAGLVLGAAVGLIDWRLGLTTLAVAAGLTSVVGLVRRSSTVPLGPGLIAVAAWSLAWPGVLVPGAAA